MRLRCISKLRKLPLWRQDRIERHLQAFPVQPPYSDLSSKPSPADAGAFARDLLEFSGGVQNAFDPTIWNLGPPPSVPNASAAKCLR